MSSEAIRGNLTIFYDTLDSDPTDEQPMIGRLTRH